MRRMLVAVTLLALVSCSRSTPTSPAPPEPPGVPQTLTVEATPTTIPHTGENVRLIAAVTVEPGSTMPTGIAVRLPGADLPSLLPLTRDGRLDQRVYVTTGGDLVVTAGTLERRIAITQTPAPPPPSSPPPTCNGGPWPCPQPPPAPPLPTPPPPPPPLAVTLTASQNPVPVNTVTRITATATGAVLYEWDTNEDGRYDDDLTQVAFIDRSFTSAGFVTIGVRARTAADATGTASIRIAVVSGLR